MLHRLNSGAQQKKSAQEGPLKVAIIISDFPLLNETFILDHITGLLDRGHEVHIYATTPVGLTKIHEPVKTYNLLAHTIYRDASKFTMPRQKILRALKGGALLAQGFQKNPRAALNSLNVLRLGKEAACLRALFRIAPFFTFSKYHIIHCHFPQNGHLALFLRDLSAITGKIVTSFHGYNRPYFRNEPTNRLFDDKKKTARGYNRSYSKIFDDLFKKGDLFLTCSEHMKHWYEQASQTRGRFIVHRYGVHTSHFHPSRRSSHNHGEVRLLSVGRLVEKKGFEYAIRGVATILRHFPTLQYRIAGDGPERSNLERLISELGLVRNVQLLGWRDREEVLRLFGQSHIFLAPSVTSQHGDQEGIPLVLHEAMALGLPVVSTVHTGIPELVQDGESGFLLAERDVNGIADRLSYLMKHPDIWQEMGQKGRKHIEEYNDLDKQNDRLVAVYRSLVDPQGAA